jgi:hypothetical protein
MELISNIKAASLLQAACRSPEALHAYIQANIVPEDLLQQIDLYLFRAYREHVPHFDSVFAVNPSANWLRSKNRYNQLYGRRALHPEGAFFTVDKSPAMSFSVVDALIDLPTMFDATAESAESCAYPSSSAMGWLLLLQLPLVKAYNPFAYECILSRLYAYLATDKNLLSAAWYDHNKRTVFTPHNFSRVYQSEAKKYNVYYPGLSDYYSEAQTDHLNKVRLHTDKFTFKSDDPTSQQRLSALITNQLMCVVPSARHGMAFLSGNFLFDAGTYLDPSSGTLSTSNPLHSVATLVGVKTALPDCDTYLDLEGIDRLYAEEATTPIRYAVMYRIAEYAALRRLKRDVRFMSHIYSSLGAIFGYSSGSSKDARSFLYNQVKDSFSEFPETAELLQDLSCAGSMSLEDSFNRQYFTVSIHKFFNRVENFCEPAKAFVTALPSVTYLTTNTWKLLSSVAVNKDIYEPSTLITPSCSRKSSEYFMAYTASLASAIGSYLSRPGVPAATHINDEFVFDMPLYRLASEIGVAHDFIEPKSTKAPRAPIAQRHDIFGLEPFMYVNLPRYMRFLSYCGNFGTFLRGLVPIHRAIDAKIAGNAISLKTDKASELFNWHPVKGEGKNLVRYSELLHRINRDIVPLLFGSAPVQSMFYSELAELEESKTAFNFHPIWIDYRNSVLSASDLLETRRCFCVPIAPVLSLIRGAYSRCHNGVKDTFCVVKEKIVSSSGKKPKTRSGFNYYQLKHTLSDGRVMPVKLINKGYQTYVSLPWRHLHEWYGILPIRPEIAYSRNISSKLKLKFATDDERKTSNRWLYMTFYDWVVRDKYEDMKKLLDWWGQDFNEERRRLSSCKSLRLFSGVGFVLSLDAFSTHGDNDWGHGNPMDTIPDFESFITEWRNVDFSVFKNGSFKTSVSVRRQKALDDHKAAYALNKRLGDPDGKKMRLHFTAEEDLAILRLYRKDMTEDDRRELMFSCPDRTWFVIANRANRLAVKMIKEDGVTDLDKLPVVRVSVNIKCALEEARENARQKSSIAHCTRHTTTRSRY